VIAGSSEIMAIEKKYRKLNVELKIDKMFNGIDFDTVENCRNFYCRKFIPSSAYVNNLWRHSQHPTLRYPFSPPSPIHFLINQKGA
jgi:hypothetical protein